MKITDIDAVRSLLWKVEDRTKLLQLLRTTSNIHVSILRGHRDNEHMHFGAQDDGQSNRYDITEINTHLMQIVQAEILMYKAQLINLGIEFTEEIPDAI